MEAHSVSISIPLFSFKVGHKHQLSLLHLNQGSIGAYKYTGKKVIVGGNMNCESDLFSW